MLVQIPEATSELPRYQLPWRLQLHRVDR